MCCSLMLYFMHLGNCLSYIHTQSQCGRCLHFIDVVSHRAVRGTGRVHPGNAASLPQERQLFMLRFTPLDNLELSVNPCLCTVGGSQSSLGEPTQNDLSWPVGSKSEPSGCETTVQTTLAPCHPTFLPKDLNLFFPSTSTHWSMVWDGICED